MFIYEDKINKKICKDLIDVFKKNKKIKEKNKHTEMTTVFCKSSDNYLNEYSKALTKIINNYKKKYEYVDKNQASWNISPLLKIQKYKPEKCYHSWHCDSWDKPYDKPKTPDHGKIRKLSMTCQLTDGSEYKGGELEFDFRNYDPHIRDELKHKIQCKEILPKGSIIIFPSFVWHRVKPVTSGTRYSLVVWHLGKPFR